MRNLKLKSWRCFLIDLNYYLAELVYPKKNKVQIISLIQQKEILLEVRMDQLFIKFWFKLGTKKWLSKLLIKKKLLFWRNEKVFKCSSLYSKSCYYWAKSSQTRLQSSDLVLFEWILSLKCNESKKIQWSFDLLCKSLFRSIFSK